jgi:hypothetical protein
VLVVDDASADPGIVGVTPIPLDEDHITICKPTSRSALQYMMVKRFCEDTLIRGREHSADKNRPPQQDIDKIMLQKYSVVFDRPTFQVPCIFEGALYWLDEALSDVTAAMGTGKVYSREGRLLADVDPISAFKSEECRVVLSKVRSTILQVRTLIATLDAHIAGELKSQSMKIARLPPHLQDKVVVNGMSLGDAMKIARLPLDLQVQVLAEGIVSLGAALTQAEAEGATLTQAEAEGSILVNATSASDKGPYFHMEFTLQTLIRRGTPTGVYQESILTDG